MIFENNTAYQTYRVFVSIFGTLGMVVATSPMKKNYKRNNLLLHQDFNIAIPSSPFLRGDVSSALSFCIWTLRS